MSFREYYQRAKAQDSLIRRKRLIFFSLVLAPFVCLLAAWLARPVQLMESLTNIAHHLGFSATANDLHQRTQLLQAEQQIKDEFNDTPFWIELPASHQSAFVAAYLDSFDKNCSIVIFPVSKTSFKACVPRSLRERFTVEKLDAAPTLKQ